MVDSNEGVIGIEWIEGKSVRRILGGGADAEEAESSEDDFPEEDNPLHEYAIDIGLFSLLTHTHLETFNS